MRKVRFSSCLALLAIVVATACEKETPTKAVEVADAGAKAIDPNLAAVLPAGSAPAAPAAGESGPPATGIFAPGAADGEAKVGAAPSVKVGGTGAAPRSKLALGLAAGTKQRGTLRVSLRTGPRSALPTIDVGVAYSAGKSEEGPVPVTMSFSDVKLAPTQPGAIPDEIAKAIAKLKGSTIRYSQAPDGGGYGFTYELSRTADPGLEQLIRTVSETAEILALPAPTEALGAGGFYMVTHRSQYSGADVVTYRLVKVESIGADSVDVSVNVKRYAATTNILLAGAPAGQKIELVEFRVQGEGKFSLKPGVPLPVSAELVEQTLAAVKPAGQPVGPGQQMMTLNAEARSNFALVQAPN